MLRHVTVRAGRPCYRLIVSQTESNRRAQWWVAHRYVATALYGLVVFSSPVLACCDGALAAESYAIAMHGAPALPATFTHMPYANPDAPKGGRLVQGILGTFDSLNPLIVR